MGSSSTKIALETYIKTNWTTTSIQWEGVSFDYQGKTNWISVKYVGVSNEAYFGGRKSTNAQLQVFCYDKTSTKAHILADSVSAALSCKQIGDIEIRVGQIQGSTLNLDNGYFELMITFEINNHS